jgi:hypothetical protein
MCNFVDINMLLLTLCLYVPLRTLASVIRDSYFPLNIYLPFDHRLFKFSCCKSFRTYSSHH